MPLCLAWPRCCLPELRWNQLPSLLADHACHSQLPAEYLTEGQAPSLAAI